MKYKNKKMTILLAAGSLSVMSMLSFTACSSQEEIFYEQEEGRLTEQTSEEELSTVPEEGQQEPIQSLTLEPEIFMVHVCGAVNLPGVYKVEENSRIMDAVSAAGGFKEDAAREYVNLAARVEDGMKVTIPTMTQVSDMQQTGQTPEFAAIENEEKDSSAPNTEEGAKVNINTADEAALCTLSGIGATRAKSIIAYREENGAFTAIEEIMKVDGIKEGSFTKIKELITVK